MSRVVRAWMIALVFLVCACGGATAISGEDEGATKQDADALCDAQCSRTARCNPDQPADRSCGSSCKENLTPTAFHIRADFLRRFAECLAGSDCGERSDSCLKEAAAAVGVTEATINASPDAQACQAKQAACRDTSGDFDDDVCGNMLLLVPASRSGVADCFQNACETVPACLEPFFGD